MYLKHLFIQNFRALSKIDVEFSEGVNVIVGPNAIGKTTVLEAIRLAKAILAPRSGSEAQQTLMSLSAMSPHNPNQLITSALTQYSSIPLEIRCSYQLNGEEFSLLTNNIAAIASNLVQTRLGVASNPATFTAFLSSPDGRRALQGAEAEINDGLRRLPLASNVCPLNLQIDFNASKIDTPDPISAAFIAFLDRSLPPDRTKFSYFTADRALPRGEVQIQLGSQDAQQQIESHNSQPQLKYGRLKNTIFSTIISSSDGRAVLENEFRKIFDGLLKGKELIGAEISQHGLLSITIRDKDSGRTFDIDGLSSGEKGLVLTFLLIGRTLSTDGVVLLDEPELHLNPAVCKYLLSFIVDQYVIPNNLQVIICSHSPEILAGAFGRDKCSLYHLVSGTMLTKVRQSDDEEITEALRLLGTSESDGLLYRATIFVEGPQDIEILEAGFGHLFRNFKLKDLGGRSEIEKHIRALQESEKRGNPVTPKYFIFDKDEAPTSLQSTQNVKVLQWGKRCLENYLIDENVIADLLQDTDITHETVSSVGKVTTILKELALRHLDDQVIKDVYDAYKFENVGRRPDEVAGKDYSEAADIFFKKIETVGQQLTKSNKAVWTKEFIDLCNKRKAELLPVWETKWAELCDGKRLFKEFQGSSHLKISLLSFKKRIIQKSSGPVTSDNWRLIESLVKELLQ